MQQGASRPRPDAPNWRIVRACTAELPVISEMDRSAASAAPARAKELPATTDRPGTCSAFEAGERSGGIVRIVSEIDVPEVHAPQAQAGDSDAGTGEPSCLRC